MKFGNYEGRPVEWRGMHWRMREVLKQADRIWQNHGHKLVVTAVLDGEHSPWSWHYYGCAVDLRLAMFTSMAERSQVVEELGTALLGGPYQLVEHDTHLHVEFDPVAFRLT